MEAKAKTEQRKNIFEKERMGGKWRQKNETCPFRCLRGDEIFAPDISAARFEKNWI
jgi:hypothetical protein